MLDELRERLRILCDAQLKLSPYCFASAWQEFSAWLAQNEQCFAAGWIMRGSWREATIDEVRCAITDALELLSEQATMIRARHERQHELWVAPRANCDAGHSIRILGVTVQLSARAGYRS